MLLYLSLRLEKGTGMIKNAYINLESVLERYNYLLKKSYISTILASIGIVISITGAAYGVYCLTTNVQYIVKYTVYLELIVMIFGILIFVNSIRHNFLLRKDLKYSLDLYSNTPVKCFTTEELRKTQKEIYDRIINSKMSSRHNHLNDLM